MRSLVSLGLRLGSAVCMLTALLGAPAIGATVVRTMVYHQLTTFTNNGVQGTTRPLLLSANGQKMVFPRPWYGSPRSNLIYTVNFDGSALTLADSWAIDPYAEVDISADGSKIISYQSGLCRVAAADGSSASTIVQLEGGYSTFRLSSDGAFVYFLVDRDTALSPSHQSIEAGVYRMGANGTSLQMLANRTNVAQFLGTTPDQIGFYNVIGSIALSGNGARLLFQCYQGGYRLIGMNSDGSGLREYPLGTVPDIYAFQIWNFGLSGDGNKLFYHVARNTGPQEVGVFNFDGTGQRGLLTNNIGLYGEVMQLNPDGSKLLLGGTGWLLNTDGSGQLELGWSARFAVNNVLEYGLYHGVMDTNATHFAYLTPAGTHDGGRLQIGSAELNPANLGLAPTITSPSANPAFITTNGPSPVFAFNPEPTNGLLSGGGAQAGILLNGVADPATWQGSTLHDDGSYGDAVKGDGIYSDNTGYYNSTPAIGPRTLRYKAELLAGDGKYHATAVDVAPFFVVAQAPTNPPPAIISITPSDAPPGSSVTITGTGFDPLANNNVILFGNVPAQVISVNLAGTQLVVVVPSDLPAGPVAVTVSSTGQTSSPGQTSGPTNSPITKLIRLAIRSANAANWEVSWASSSNVYHLETADSLTPPVRWVPLDLPSSSVVGRETVNVPKPATGAVYFRARTEGTVLPDSAYVSAVRSLSSVAELDGTGGAEGFQNQISASLEDFANSLAAWALALDNISGQADAALTGALAGIGSNVVARLSAYASELPRVKPLDSGFVPGPLTDIINQFKQVKQTVDDLTKLKGKLQQGSEILSWLTQNKSLDEIVSAHSGFLKEISGIFQQMRQGVEGPLGEIIDGKNAGKSEDAADFNALVQFVSATDARLGQLIEQVSAPGFTLDSYRNLNLTDRQRDLVAQAFRTSTLRGGLYLRDNLLPFLKTLASAGVETYADAIFDATGAKKGANVFKSALEYSQKIYAFLSGGSGTPPTPLRFDCRRRFLATDDLDSDVKADLFLVAKLADGTTRLATFLVRGRTVVSETNGLLLAGGLPVPALAYDILVVPRDQQGEAIKLLPLATSVDANLTTFVDLPMVAGTRLTVRPDPQRRDASGNLQPATLSLDQIQNLDVHVEGFGQTADGPVRGLFSTETRQDGTVSLFFIVPFLPPNRPLTLSITSTNIEPFSQSITIQSAEQELVAPVVLVPPPPPVSTVTLEISWKLYDGYYTLNPQLIASGAGTNFSTVLTNRVTVNAGRTNAVTTNVVTTLAGSLSWTPIAAGNPFDVTCALSASIPGPARGVLNLSTYSGFLGSSLPAALWLKAAFREVVAGSGLYKADLIGSKNFSGWNKSFLSADVSGEGFAGNFSLSPRSNALCGHDGTLCFQAGLQINNSDSEYDYTYAGDYLLFIQALFK